jgi:hypothetical protein
MNYETLYHGWSFVNAIACKAENQIYQAIETCRKGEGPGPLVAPGRPKRAVGAMRGFPVVREKIAVHTSGDCTDTARPGDLAS